MTEILLSFSNPTFAAYATYGTILLVKMILLLIMTSYTRITRKVYSNEEDVLTFAGKIDIKKALAKNNSIERIKRCYQNDLENIIPFLILSCFYILLQPSHATALMLFRVFTAARVLHTITYLLSLQPYRALCWGVNLSINLYLSVKILQQGVF
ncbi:microsomal glutathione S-transferase 1-like [Saccoglossus kowalevskii]|uniref:Microsomal glutathione S-transferase 1 n=1 Tax=Saccoglossus kowalevskii TaxID=10224 RepID=A0ABM0GW54_SACKO|nr:PREDICTED: microsomal glutathione S-transferase 1-like [Saccoglossus kowalevskii]